jgi:AcrR family transcriptional regulator
LAAAASVVGSEGLSNLTVAGVATEAGVSRQWVYEHFTDLDDLYRALILDRFAVLDTAIDEAREHLTGESLALFAARQVFALPPADRRILHALVSGVGWNRPELIGIEADLRERVLQRWTGFVTTTGRPAPEARAVVWAVVMATFGLADQIERESLPVELAVGVLTQLIVALAANENPTRRRSPPVEARR